MKTLATCWTPSETCGWGSARSASYLRISTVIINIYIICRTGVLCWPGAAGGPGTPTPPASATAGCWPPATSWRPARTASPGPPPGSTWTTVSDYMLSRIVKLCVSNWNISSVHLENFSIFWITIWRYENYEENWRLHVQVEEVVCV